MANIPEIIYEDNHLIAINKPAGVEIAPNKALLRIANPTDLLRQPTDTTINFGFLQNTETQKALFLTPSYEWASKKLNSKTPPLFVDAFRVVNSKKSYTQFSNCIQCF